MPKEYEELNYPVVADFSQLYCKHGNKKCKFLLIASEWCAARHKDVRATSGWKTPDWCTLKWDAWFPKNKDK
jgi:hypothetical protein